jgi:sulfur relay (sulfurtransferase) complex TusBCD TusD component (DsrE family)
VQIFLLGEAVTVMRTAVASSLVPVGWPPLSEALTAVVGKKIPIHVWGACARARGVLEFDLTEKNATLATPAVLVGLVESADKVLTE